MKLKPEQHKLFDKIGGYSQIWAGRLRRPFILSYRLKHEKINYQTRLILLKFEQKIPRLDGIVTYNFFSPNYLAVALPWLIGVIIFSYLIGILCLSMIPSLVLPKSDWVLEECFSYMLAEDLEDFCGLSYEDSLKRAKELAHAGVYYLG